jgi:transcriptional regulator with GAF, ATPase, and Fis domain
MNARLIRFDGGRNAEIWLDCSRPFTIGRDPTNTLAIDAPMVSLHHCRIECEADQFVLVDEKSTNGTYVNDEAVQKRYLRSGDGIRLGFAKLLFIGEGAGEIVSLVAEVDESDGVTADTLQLNPDDSAYFNTEPAGDGAYFERMARDTSVLLKLSVEINQIEEAGRLQEILLERLFEMVPAESGAILLSSGVDGEFAPSPVYRQTRPGQQVVISRTISRKVLQSGQSLLRNNLLEDDSSSDSIFVLGIRSALCVPLKAASTRIGVIYLQTADSENQFDERHLELATAVASIGALALEHVWYVEWLERENRQLSHEVNLQHEMVGDCPAMRKVYEALSLVAPVDTPVLLLGESGTGKELAARAIHKNSSRRNGPFVVVNCGAISAELFASELFGHIRGAFTDASRDRKGFIEAADGGTLFLDELGELPPHCQASLLRVLEDGQIFRVGSTVAIPVNIRLVSATNRSLRKEIEEGGFRADLYHRMGLPLELPPLRERVDDIPLLVNFFLQKHRHKTQRELGRTPPDTIRALQEYRWPGNVRELGRVIEWAVIFGKSDRIRRDELPANVTQKLSKTPGGSLTLDQAMESFERQFILRALEETNGNVVEASALIGRAPNYLQRRISALNLRDELTKIRRKQN